MLAEKTTNELWFDVGIKRYTTVMLFHKLLNCCGLM